MPGSISGFSIHFPLLYFSTLVILWNILQLYSFIKDLHMYQSNHPVFLFFKSNLAILGPVHLYINLRINLTISIKNAEVHIGIALKLYINLGRTNTFTIWSLSIHDYGLFLHSCRTYEFSLNNILCVKILIILSHLFLVLDSFDIITSVIFI